MGSLDEKKAVFEELTLCDFNKWSSTASIAHFQVLEIFGSRNPLKMNQNDFQLKYSSRSHDTLIFVLNF